MYWRVRKITAQQLARQYGAHFALGISLFVNLILIVTRPVTPKLSPELKLTAVSFCKQVTQHLLDTSYISYLDSTTALLSGELSPTVINSMRGQGLIAKTEEDLRAQARSLIDQRQVAAVKITDVIPHDPPNANAPTPVDVKGVVAIHSSQDEKGANEPLPFFFRFAVGARVGPDGKPEMVNNNPVLMIADFRDLSGGRGP